MNEEDINFLISIQDLEQPEFDNACLERENKRLTKEIKRLKKELKIKDRKIHHALGYMENAYPEPDWHYVYEILDKVGEDKE